MKIKVKFILMVAIPIAAIAVLVIVGLTSFLSIRNSTTNIDAIQEDRATMLEGDRDAYQAYVAQILAPQTLDPQEVQTLVDSNKENQQQTWERISGPGERFPENMQPKLATFSEAYYAWEQNGTSILDLAAEVATHKAERQAADANAIASFDDMRSHIDELGVMVDNALTLNLSAARRANLETAQSLILNGDRDAYQAYVAQLEILDATSGSEIDELKATSVENLDQAVSRVSQGADILGGSALAIKDQFVTSFNAWRAQSQAVVDISEQIAGQIANIATLTGLNTGLFDTMRTSIDELGQMQTERVQQETAVVMDTITSTIWIYLIVALIAVAITIAVVAFMASRITGPLRRGVQVADQISRGDLSADLAISQRDEIGQLADAMNRMIAEIRKKAAVLNAIAQGDLTSEVEKSSEVDELGESLEQMTESLNTVLRQVNESVLQLSSGSDQVAQSSQALSQGATEQASSLEEISASLAEIDGQSRNNVELAEKGNSQMKELLQAMERINASSDAIRKVVKVIDDIAFQINLLALNANVEAARAGKYGKGFAVVAEEVRNLAVRSTEAVKETATMVDETVKNMELGNGLVAETAQQLEAMAIASKEQASGVTQINLGLDQIDRVTQSTTASAEESAAAAEELASQAQQLKAMIAQFRLAGSQRPVIHLPDDDDHDDAGSSNGNGHDKDAAEHAHEFEYAQTNS